ncbi:hypothetical protein [Conchiformibius steedae]|uniref:hypothetical protein n=1 Tax=Conchiformibius steedae TaxID=153493 RepID=UPI0026EA4C17|nr:hypothetical protein [Conchiformibius steedae]
MFGTHQLQKVVYWIGCGVAVLALSGCYLSIGGGGKKKQTEVIVPAGSGQNNVTVPVVIPNAPAATPAQPSRDLQPTHSR